MPMAHRPLAHALPRHDEGAADVAVLDEAFAVLHAQLQCQLHRRRPARIGDRDHHVDVQVAVLAPDLLGQALAHAQARLVDGDAVDHRVGARQVHVLEDARIERCVGRALLAVEVPVHIDEDRLARRHVAHQPIPLHVQRDALGGNQVFGALAGLRGAEHQRADAVRVAEREQPVPGDHRHHCIGAPAAAMHAGNGLEDGGGVERVRAGGLLQLVRQHVEKHLGVGVGVDVTQVLAEQVAFELLGVGQVAVVTQHDPERGVDVQGLGFGRVVGGTGGRVAAVADAGLAEQVAHVAGAEHVAHQAAALLHVEGTLLRVGHSRARSPAFTTVGVPQRPQYWCERSQSITWTARPASANSASSTSPNRPRRPVHVMPSGGATPAATSHA
jgi:hypothetical protein